MESKSLFMQVVYTHAAGIDVGSKEYFVATGQGVDQVSCLGAYAEDLKARVPHL